MMHETFEVKVTFTIEAQDGEAARAAVQQAMRATTVDETIDYDTDAEFTSYSVSQAKRDYEKP